MKITCWQLPFPQFCNQQDRAVEYTVNLKQILLKETVREWVYILFFINQVIHIHKAKLALIKQIKTFFWLITITNPHKYFIYLKWILTTAVNKWKKKMHLKKLGL